MPDIRLEDCVGRTFERDGMKIYIDMVGSIAWVLQDDKIVYTVHKPFLKSWLAGAVEVEGEK